MTSREQFEAWVRERALKYGYSHMPSLLNQSCEGQYASTSVNMAWEGWQASREALAVDLPDKQFISEEDVLIPDEVDWPDGFNTALEQCAEAIRAAGIKVKGE